MPISTTRQRQKEATPKVANFNLFFDKLARACIAYEVRILCLDANMALFQIVPEMRVRGFQINLAAWFPWKHELAAGQYQTMVDSTAVFILGPTCGIRMPLSCDVFAQGYKAMQVQAPLLQGGNHQPLTHYKKMKNGILTS